MSSDHDDFHVNSATGWCDYCASFHDLGQAPPAQVYDRILGAWVFPVVAGDVGEPVRHVEIEPFPEAVPVVEPEVEPVPERELEPA